MRLFSLMCLLPSVRPPGFNPHPFGRRRRPPPRNEERDAQGIVILGVRAQAIGLRSCVEGMLGTSETMLHRVEPRGRRCSDWRGLFPIPCGGCADTHCTSARKRFWKCCSREGSLTCMRWTSKILQEVGCFRSGSTKNGRKVYDDLVNDVNKGSEGVDSIKQTCKTKKAAVDVAKPRPRQPAARDRGRGRGRACSKAIPPIHEIAGSAPNLRYLPEDALTQTELKLRQPLGSRVWHT